MKSRQKKEIKKMKGKEQQNENTWNQINTELLKHKDLNEDYCVQMLQKYNHAT